MPEINSITIIRRILPLLVAASTVCAEETKYTAERYVVILERAPFGSDPLLDGVNSSSAQAAAAAARELRLCFLLESESGEVRAGFQNLKAGPGDPKSVILMEGESFMGMKLLSINILDSQATLESRGELVVFELTKAAAAARPTAAPAAVATASPQQPQRRFGGGFRRREPPPAPAPEPPQPELTPEEEAIRREEVRANLQEYQMEVIRSGMPPLPIPLTQEMDDQLVAEGVLPPIEPDEGLPE